MGIQAHCACRTQVTEEVVVPVGVRPAIIAVAWFAVACAGAVRPVPQIARLLQTDEVIARSSKAAPGGEVRLHLQLQSAARTPSVSANT